MRPAEQQVIEKDVNGCQITLSFSASPVNGVIEKIQSILSNAYDERVQNDLTGIVSAGVRHKAGSKAGSVGYQEETAPTLLAGQQSAVFSADCSQLIVRRLTPTEAERLQGCPDNWTKYGADGKTISDTKRYSMLGNGIAAPCAAYIMQGIRQAIERSD